MKIKHIIYICILIIILIVIPIVIPIKKVDAQEIKLVKEQDSEIMSIVKANGKQYKKANLFCVSSEYNLVLNEYLEKYDLDSYSDLQRLDSSCDFVCQNLVKSEEFSNLVESVESFGLDSFCVEQNQVWECMSGKSYLKSQVLPEITIDNKIKCVDGYYYLGPINNLSNNLEKLEVLKDNEQVSFVLCDENAKPIIDFANCNKAYVRIKQQDGNFKVIANYTEQIMKKYLYGSQNSLKYNPILELEKTSQQKTVDNEFNINSNKYPVSIYFNTSCEEKCILKMKSNEGFLKSDYIIDQKDKLYRTYYVYPQESLDFNIDKIIIEDGKQSLANYFIHIDFEEQEELKVKEIKIESNSIFEKDNFDISYQIDNDKIYFNISEKNEYLKINSKVKNENEIKPYDEIIVQIDFENLMDKKYIANEIKLEVPQGLVFEKVLSNNYFLKDEDNLIFENLESDESLQVAFIASDVFDVCLNTYVLSIKQKDTNEIIPYDKKDILNIKVKKQEFDLALRMYISEVNGKKQEREPQIVIEDEYKYYHTKDPLSVNLLDEITYTINIINESQDEGYASEIDCFIPDGIDFVNVNSKYYYCYSYEQNILKIKSKEEIKALKCYEIENEVHSIDINCKVSNIPTNKEITCISYINSYKNTSKDIEINENNNFEEINGKDKDSDIGFNLSAINLEKYNGNIENSSNLDKYFKGCEDDDDFEKVILYETDIDLALRMYISKIDGKEQTNREPKINIDDEISYIHKKNPLEVYENSIVEFDINVYNEGTSKACASQITNLLPKYLEFVEIVFGDYEVLDYDTSSNILKLNKKNDEYLDGCFDELSKSSVRIKCKVKQIDDKKDIVLTNYAYISKIKAKNNQNPKDKDSNVDVFMDFSKTSRANYTGKDNLTDEQLEEDKYFKGFEDDDDFEKLIVKYKPFDFKLVTTISEINFDEIDERLEQIDCSSLNMRDETNTILTNGTYKINKEPILVNSSSLIKIKYRVFNEGLKDGYASQIIQEIPSGIEFLWSGLEGEELENLGKYTKNEIEAIKFNKSQYWVFDEYKNQIKTDYLSKEKELFEGDNLILGLEDSNINYKEVSLILKVNSSSLGEIIRLNSYISNVTNCNSDSVNDRDSSPQYIGTEDDEDYEQIQIQAYDIALKQFILGISSDNIYDQEDTIKNSQNKVKRMPKVDTSILDKSDTTSNFITDKSNLIATDNEYVIFNIRVYNEGATNVYVSNLEYLYTNDFEFEENDFNQKYGWTKQINQIKEIKEINCLNTNYLENKVLDARSQDGQFLLSYLDVPLMLKINKQQRNIIKDNKEPQDLIYTIAQLKEAKDQNGLQIIDRDSNKYLEFNTKEELENYNFEMLEDDEDYEVLNCLIFDLSLKLELEATTLNKDDKDYEIQINKEKQIQSKVEIDKQGLSNQTIKYKYKITIKNEGTMPGFANEIVNYIPKGLVFNQEENPNWEQIDENTIISKELENQIINQNEEKEIYLTLNWDRNMQNIGLMQNISKIAFSSNDFNILDIDSDYNSLDYLADDLDVSTVLVTKATGQKRIWYFLILIFIPLIFLIVFLLKNEETIKNKMKKKQKK